MKYWQLITTLVLTIVMFLMSLSSPLSVWAASSSSVTRSLLNEAKGENFSNKNLIRAEFTSTTFQNTNFSNADLRGALFNGVVFDGANLHGIDFSSGIAYVSRFKNVDLSDSILADSNMLRSVFDRVDVTGADFSDALLDFTEIKKICLTASGTNSKTGVDTRESLGCD